MNRKTYMVDQFSQLYEQIKKDQLDCNLNYCIRIFTSSLAKAESIALAKQIKQHFRNSTILGATSCKSILFNGTQEERKTMVIFESYKQSTIHALFLDYHQYTNEQLAQEFHQFFIQIPNIETSAIHTLFSEGYHEIFEFVSSINQYSPILKLVGGVCGIEKQGFHGYVFNEYGASEHSVMAYAICGQHTSHFINSATSMEVISSPVQITKSNGVYIHEIEHQDAITWMDNFLFTKQDGTYYEEKDRIDRNDILTHFPLLVQDDHLSSRITSFDYINNTLTLNKSHLPPSTYVRIGYLNATKTMQEGLHLCERMLNEPIDALFVYSCFLRMEFFQNCSDWEISTIAKHNPCGIYLLGEIANIDEKNYYYNAAFVLSGFSESDHLCIPSLATLENLVAIQENPLYTQIAKHKGKAYLRQSQKQVSSQYNEVDTSNKYIDLQLNLANAFQYEEDRTKLNFDKIILCENMSADSAIVAFSDQEYYTFAQECIQKFHQFFKQHHVGQHIACYSINYKSIIFAANDSIPLEQFIEIAQDFHTAYEYMTCPTIGISFVLRNIVAYGGGNMIEAALNFLLSHKDQQDNFFICDTKTALNHSITDDTQTIQLLIRAIKEHRIIPFYQGLRNNQTGKIDKYEALMRIVEEDGTIHSPGTFLDVAKRYKLYKQISQLMVEQVLHDSLQCDFDISLNISLYDIQSSSFRTKLIQMLKKHPNPQRITIEFVETENLQNFDLIHEFIGQLRQVGAKIAIDDFGSGYSTFTSLTALYPDYIKIDGSIIHDIHLSQSRIIVLKSIQFLAEQIGAKTIAEFVENQEIQNIIEQYNIPYSQGYLYAKPLPLIKIIK